MKIIKPSVEFLGEVPTDYEGNLQFIERAGRTCYKSESKGDSEAFVRKLIKSGHLAMVEHSNFVIRKRELDFIYDDGISAAVGKYLTFRRYNKGVAYIGGSLTAWAQNAVRNGFPVYADEFAELFCKLFDISDEYIGGSGEWESCPHDEIPKSLHRYSVKFICDRGVSHELVRHRPCSFAQESTRYVNYGGKDMEFIEPTGFEDWSGLSKYEFIRACEQGEAAYNIMLRGKSSPQQARAVLPNALKTEIIVTADAAEWAHIKRLRTDKAAHPDMQRVMNMVPWEEILC